MARYRQKDETDLAWNKVRRRITRELDTQLADWRERVLNELLSDAWTKYAAALDKGEVLELAPSLKEFVAGALDQAIDVR